MNPYRKENEPKVKVASRAASSITPVLVLLLVSVVVLLISGAKRTYKNPLRNERVFWFYRVRV